MKCACPAAPPMPAVLTTLAVCATLLVFVVFVALAVFVALVAPVVVRFPLAAKTPVWTPASEGARAPLLRGLVVEVTPHELAPPPVEPAEALAPVWTPPVPAEAG